MNNYSHLLALPLVLGLGASIASAQPAPTRVDVTGIANTEADAFMEWVLDDPARLRAAFEEFGVDAGDATEITEAAQEAGIAGTYRLRKSMTHTATTTLEVGAGFEVTRTVRKDGRVQSKVAGQGVIQDGKLRVRFGAEQVEAEGAASRIGRFFKRGWRKARSTAKLRDAVYEFPGSGVVKGRFLGAPESGYRVDRILPVEGTYLLKASGGRAMTLVVASTGVDGKLQVTRTVTKGVVLRGQARTVSAIGVLRGGLLKVKFPRHQRASYRFRVDARRVDGLFRGSIEKGWREGVQAESTWLQRRIATWKRSVAKLQARVKVLVQRLVARVKAQFAALVVKGRALVAKGKALLAEGVATGRALVAKGQALIAKGLLEGRALAKKVKVKVQASVASLVSKVKNSAARLRARVRPANG